MRLVLECTVTHEIHVDPQEAADIMAMAKIYGAGSTEVAESFARTRPEYISAELYAGAPGEEEKIA